MICLAQPNFISTMKMWMLKRVTLYIMFIRVLRELKQRHRHYMKLIRSHGLEYILLVSTLRSKTTVLNVDS